MSASSRTASSSFRQSPMPAYREPLPLHPPRGGHHHTCRCPQCHLRSSLFPRGERGTILLPRLGQLHSDRSGAVSGVPRSLSRAGNRKGKGKETAVSRSRGFRVDPSEGPSRRKPLARKSRLSSESSTPTPISPLRTSAEPVVEGIPSETTNLAPILSPNIAGPSRLPLPSVNSLEPPKLSPTFHSQIPPQVGSKRKLEEVYDSLNPTEHVLDFRNPTSVPGRGLSRGLPRQRLSMSDLVSSHSPQETPELHTQSYRSLVSESSELRTIALDSDNHTETARLSRPRSYSENVYGYNPSASVQQHHPGKTGRSHSPEGARQRRPSPPGETAMGESNARLSILRFSARNDNPFPSNESPGSPMGVSPDTSANASRQPSTSFMAAPIPTNPIRFREPLTADSRHDRRVVKGGVAVMQVKWDSDRKRRQGYFAPDVGSEKSKFRHYNKDDCCFDE